MPLVSAAMRSTRVRGTPMALASAPADRSSGKQEFLAQDFAGVQRREFFGPCFEHFGCIVK